MTSKEKEKDSLEKVSEDLMDASALLRSLHGRLVEVSMAHDVPKETFESVRVAINALLRSREYLGMAMGKARREAK
jgi:hypothetical protein